ncbi:hypothetical protein [Micromonospora sp. CA-248212]|uniref:hypothetical protein n=1 Tax=Micromonospora sp. CA-248212 TaxID=3239961 RepID=UPI003D8E876F
MTWFKVDDGLHKHRKRIRCGLDIEGFAALGLWTTAGSWSSDELTDGWIPDDVIDYLAPGIGQQLAKRLERAALWNRVTRDGEEGWQFHEWTDHQPTREQVLAERAAAALRQKRARDRAKEKRDEEGQNLAPSRRDSRVTDADTHGDVTPAVTVPPTRPDPTYIQPPSEVADEAALFEQPASQTKSRTKPKQSTGDPTETQRAFGLARQWSDFREKQGTPIVVAGKGENLDLHKLRNLIEPFLKKGYTDDEVKRGLVATGEGIPSTASLDRALTRLRNQQNGRMDGGMKPANPRILRNSHENQDRYDVKL